MTDVYFWGKEFVWNHHLAVPHRPLVPGATSWITAGEWRRLL